MALAETGTRALLAPRGLRGEPGRGQPGRQLLPCAPGQLVLLDRAFDASAFRARSPRPGRAAGPRHVHPQAAGPGTCPTAPICPSWTAAADHEPTAGPAPTAAASRHHRLITTRPTPPLPAAACRLSPRGVDGLLACGTPAHASPRSTPRTESGTLTVYQRQPTRTPTDHRQLTTAIERAPAHRAAASPRPPTAPPPPPHPRRPAPATAPQRQSTTSRTTPHTRPPPPPSPRRHHHCTPPHLAPTHRTPHTPPTPTHSHTRQTPPPHHNSPAHKPPTPPTPHPHHTTPHHPHPPNQTPPGRGERLDLSGIQHPGGAEYGERVAMPHWQRRHPRGSAGVPLRAPEPVEPHELAARRNRLGPSEALPRR